MLKTVDYFFSTVSPWTYLGHERFRAMARKHGATINVRPCDLAGKVFPVSGGVPVKQRAPQRQAYRFLELKRWRAFLGLPLNLEPKFFPTDPEPSSRLIIAASQLSSEAAMTLTGAVLRACWAEERNVADADTLRAILRENGFDPEALTRHAQSAPVKAVYEAYTKEAIDKGVFGAPSYIVDGELFWGQDRLDFVERALAPG
jgi:2-hydroxychromene-2-carboxylate isomerase